MALADRVEEIVRGLPRGWERARLELAVEEPEDADRAALILAPATPGRSGTAFTVYVHGGTRRLAPTPELVRRVVSRLDSEGIRARIRLAGHEAGHAAAPEAGPRPEERRSLAASWDALVQRAGRHGHPLVDLRGELGQLLPAIAIRLQHAIQQ